jgi:uncharacterized membrane protein YpjA
VESVTDDETSLPGRLVEYYLGNGPSLVWLLVVNATAFLVGVSFYVHSDPSLRDVPTFLYPLFGDSPAALALATLSLATLLPTLGLPVRDAPQNRPLAYLHTLAFVWLVKYGVWTVVALWNYWGIMLTHALFLVEAAVIPRFGRTTRGALVFALGLALVNDVYDYGFGFYPPLRYDATETLLPAITVGLSVGSVLLAARLFDRL